MAMTGMDALRLGIGARALLGTWSAARLQFGHEPSTGDVVVLRILGVRQVAQALLSAAIGLRSLGAVVDLLHAGSMLIPLAVAPRRLGRFAMVQLVTASLLAVLGLRADRRG